MVCIICKKTEEELRIDNSQEIADIDNVISIIDDKIKNIMLGQLSEQEKNDEKTFNNCMGETGNYCQNCTYVEPVDDAEYFWCKIHKKTFSLSVNSIIKQLKKEIDVLKLTRKEIENINLEIVELKLDTPGEKYTRIMLTYLPDFSKQDQHSSIYICKNCNLFLDKIVENKISERMDDIIATVRNEIEEDDADEN